MMDVGSEWNYRRRKWQSRLLLFLLVLSGIIIITPLFYIFAHLLNNGLDALSPSFFTELPKPVGEPDGGMLNALQGTVMIVLMGALIGVPWGLGCGIYLSEYGRGHFAHFLRMALDLLSGTPSIVIGIFVYALLVAPLKGFSGLAGGVALAIIILPVVGRTTEEVLRLVPQDLREAGLALGLSRFWVIVKIVLGSAKTSLVTGVILAIARASGETAPLLFTAFGSLYLNWNPLEPMASLPVQIYNYAISPFEEWQQLAWAGSFVLILFILGLNLLAKLAVHWGQLKYHFLTRKKP